MEPIFIIGGLIAVIVLAFLISRKDKQTREDTIDRATLPDGTVFNNPDWEAMATCILATYANSRDNERATEERRALGEAGYTEYKKQAFPNGIFNENNTISHWTSHKSQVWPDCYPKAK